MGFRYFNRKTHRKISLFSEAPMKNRCSGGSSQARPLCRLVEAGPDVLRIKAPYRRHGIRSAPKGGMPAPTPAPANGTVVECWPLHPPGGALGSHRSVGAADRVELADDAAGKVVVVPAGVHDDPLRSRLEAGREVVRVPVPHPIPIRRLSASFQLPNGSSMMPRSARKPAMPTPTGRYSPPSVVAHR